MRTRIGRTLAAASAAAMAQATLASASAADTATLSAARDATLIESTTGAFANGAGPVIFVGRTSQSSNSRRRALVAFDVAAALPGGSVITAVTLELELSPSHAEPVEIGLHRIAVDWSEGPSSSDGGSGAASQVGDATWIHTRYDTERWSSAGGDFTAQASALAVIADAAIHGFDSTTDLVADVQAWLDAPTSNHGWILIGGEQAASTAKRFYSREAGREGEGPRLVIEYVPPCEAADLTGRALGLYARGTRCRGRRQQSRAPAAPSRLLPGRQNWHRSPRRPRS